MITISLRRDPDLYELLGPNTFPAGPVNAALRISGPFEILSENHPGVQSQVAAIPVQMIDFIILRQIIYNTVFL